MTRISRKPLVALLAFMLVAVGAVVVGEPTPAVVASTTQDTPDDTIDLTTFSDEAIDDIVRSERSSRSGAAMRGAPSAVTVGMMHAAAKKANSKKTLKRYAKKKLKGNSRQFKCLNALWARESGWNYRAANPRSSARGIPQAMMSVHFGRNWKKSTSAKKYLRSGKRQVDWGLKYINSRYKNPCAALKKQKSRGWY